MRKHPSVQTPDKKGGGQSWEQEHQASGQTASMFARALQVQWTGSGREQVYLFSVTAIMISHT